MKKINLLILVCLALGAHVLSYAMDISTDTKKRKREELRDKWYCQYPGCDKNYTTERDLLRHQKAIHIKFNCNYCSKTFKKKCDLERHERIHTGEKPFKCPYCPEAYPRNDSLKRHLFKHTGESIYTCDYCSKTFSQRGTLLAHEATHTREITYPCNYCDKAFGQKCHRTRHIKDVHKITLTPTTAALARANRLSRKASSSDSKTTFSTMPATSAIESLAAPASPNTDAIMSDAPAEFPALPMPVTEDEIDLPPLSFSTSTNVDQWFS